MPSRWAALRGRYYVHLVQMHGPFPNLVRVGAPLFARLSYVAFEQARVEAEAAEAQTVVQAETAVVARFHGDDDDE